MKTRFIPLLLASLITLLFVGCASAPSASSANEQKTSSGTLWITHH